MNLDRVRRKQLYDALLHAFTDEKDLARMVKLQMEQNLAAIAGSGNLSSVVFDLITWAEAKGKIRDLIQAAITEVPTDPGLIQVATWAGVPLPAVPADTGSESTQEPEQRSAAAGGGITGSHITIGSATIINAGTTGNVQLGPGSQWNVDSVTAGQDANLGSTVNQQQTGGVRFGDNATVAGMVAGGDINARPLDSDTCRQVKTLLEQFADAVDGARELSRPIRTDLIQRAEAAQQELDQPGARETAGQRIRELAQTLSTVEAAVAAVTPIYGILKQAGKLLNITLP